MEACKIVVMSGRVTPAFLSANYHSIPVAARCPKVPPYTHSQYYYDPSRDPEVFHETTTTSSKSH